MDKKLTRLKGIWYTYSKRIICKKNLLLLILMFILINIYLTPIKDFSAGVGVKVSPWVYPFLVSDSNFLMLFMAGCLYYFSNVPFFQRINCYYLLRIGRKRWIKEQILYIFVSSIVITLVSVCLTVIALVPNIEWQKDWGAVLYTLARTDAGSNTGLFWTVSPHFVRNVSPLFGMSVSIFLMILGITFIGMMMFFFCIYINKIVSIVVLTFLVVYSSVVANIGNVLEKKFAMVSPVSWMQITNIGLVQYGYSISPSLGYIVIMFLFLILLLGILAFYRAIKTDYIWENEDE